MQQIYIYIEKGSGAGKEKQWGGRGEGAKVKSNGRVYSPISERKISQEKKDKVMEKDEGV